MQYVILDWREKLLVNGKNWNKINFKKYSFSVKLTEIGIYNVLMKENTHPYC